MQVPIIGPDFTALALSKKLAQNAEPTKTPFALVTPETHAGEPKYDGWRILAVVGDGHVDFYSRGGISYNGKLPKVEAEILANFPAGTVLDGEAVALNVVDGKLINEWGTVQSVMTTIGAGAVADKMSFMVFDLIAHRGIDARSLPYDRRRALLEKVFAEKADLTVVKLTPQVEPTEAVYETLLEQGFEGMVIKRRNAPYASGKREGAGWIKAKGTTRVDVVIMGFKPGKSGFTGLVGSMIFGQHDPETGELVERGACSGMDMRTRLEMTAQPEKWLDRVIEIAHMGVDIGNSNSGRFRSPNFKRVRTDKTADQVVLHDA